MSVEKTHSSCGPDGDSKECASGPGSGYGAGGANWAESPRCSPEEASTISPVLAEETFRYMTFFTLEPSPTCSSSSSHPSSHTPSQVLSADRVEQMTKTYSDLDMVTHLLTERDRDLELAARIGQSLLQRNQVLQERNQAVEEQLTQALDQVQQLQHVLCKKDELLRMVASVSEESETDSSCSTPLPHTPLPAMLTVSQREALQGKLQQLEEENLALRSEACHLETETMSYEEKEQQLVNDCVKELRESNSQIVALTDELSKKNDDLLRHQEDMTELLSQMVDLQHRVRELSLEKEELRIHLQHSKDAQRQLTAELSELQQRNVECVGMLHESQEEAKELRSRSTSSAGLRRHQSYGLIPIDCLASEIEVTMRRQMSMEGQFSLQDQKDSQKRVFQTVRAVNESARHSSPRPIPGSAHGSAHSSVVMTAQPFQSCMPAAQLRRHGEAAPGASSCGATPGQPGTPGGSDSASQRLSMRRQNFLCERQFFQEEQGRKLQALAHAGEEGEEPEADGEGSGSICCFSNLTDLSSEATTFKGFLPEKLQIVKPMEGSLTLHHWQQLAQPHLAAVLDPHPGVLTKGFRPLPQDAMYHLTDLEEDEEQAEVGRRGWEKQEEEEEEEEEEGITFQVQCASTPEERRERRRERTPACSSVTAAPLSHQSQAPPTAPPPPHGPLAPTPALQQASSHILSTPAPSPAHNPGKCLSSTFSTFTITTCRILHPSDVTQVTPSSGCVSSISDNTPSSLRSVPSTPVTPYRLSLGNSSPLHCPAPTQGLAQLLLERGISAQGVSDERAPRKPAPRLLPCTPPNSPAHSPPPSPVPWETRPAPPPPADNFLASRPAEVFLQEVYGLKPAWLRPDPPGPATPLSRDRVCVSLVERLRRLGLAGVLQGAGSEGQQLKDTATPTFLATGSGSLLNGLRRNHSLPCMVRGRSQSACSASQPSPPPHHSLALPITPWGSLKDTALTPSFSSSTVQVPPSPHKF